MSGVMHGNRPKVFYHEKYVILLQDNGIRRVLTFPKWMNKCTLMGHILSRMHFRDRDDIVAAKMCTDATMIFPKEFLSLPQKNWIDHVDTAQWTQRNILRGFRFVVFYSSLGPTELITWQKTNQIAFMNIFCGICSMSDCLYHNSDVIMSTMASQITGVLIVYSTGSSGVDQRKHQTSASLAFVREIHRWPMNSPYKGLVARKMFPFHHAW